MDDNVTNQNKPLLFQVYYMLLSFWINVEIWKFITRKEIYVFKPSIDQRLFFCCCWQKSSKDSYLPFLYLNPICYTIVLRSSRRNGKHFFFNLKQIYILWGFSDHSIWKRTVSFLNQVKYLWLVNTTCTCIFVVMCSIILIRARRINLNKNVISTNYSIFVFLKRVFW